MPPVLISLTKFISNFKQLKCIYSYFHSYQSAHNEILHIRRQLCCLGMCKVSLWSDQSSLDYSLDDFLIILSLILVGWVDGRCILDATLTQRCHLHTYKWQSIISRWQHVLLRGKKLKKKNANHPCFIPNWKSLKIYHFKNMFIEFSRLINES